jgi:hypothetical protein
VRYLTEVFAVGALRRGRSIEQFLGAASGSEKPGIRWIEIAPTATGFRVVLHVVEDVGGEHFCDLVEFPPLDPGPEEIFGLEIAAADDAAEAMMIAGTRTWADPDRWVNQGMAGDEYRDFVRAGRPGQAS